jgi:hypothetical protein
VKQRGYASGAILLALVLAVSVVSRLLAKRYEQHVVR